jgi:3D (Asp-Asp-Asp) domain-containing protein
MNYYQKLKICYKKAKKLAKHLQLRKLEIAVLLVVVVEFAFPQVSLAQSIEEAQPTVVESEVIEPVLSASEPAVVETVEPIVENRQPKRVIEVIVTAYSSTVDQCDADPCITADGTDVCSRNTEDVVAANFLPFGTEIKLPEYFGDRTFIVHDRMNPRYEYRIDIWMKSRQAAKEFGVKRVMVEIY